MTLKFKPKSENTKLWTLLKYVIENLEEVSYEEI